MHFTSTSLFFLKEIINSRLNIDTKLGSWQFLSTKFVLFPLGSLLFQTVITAEALRPYLVMMQHTYLMLLPATVHAYDEGFLFQVVVLHLLELVLFYRSVNRFKYIINKNPGAGCIFRM